MGTSPRIGAYVVSLDFWSFPSVPLPPLPQCQVLISWVGPSSWGVTGSLAPLRTELLLHCGAVPSCRAGSWIPSFSSEALPGLPVSLAPDVLAPVLSAA